MTEKILQIIPAPKNLYALYTGEGEKPDRVVCLALIEDSNGDRYVSAMIPYQNEGLGSAEDVSNFYGLEFSDER